MSTYYTVLTDIGKAKQANAISLGEAVELTALAVGDGGGELPEPDSEVEALVNQQRSAAINQVSVDPDNDNYIICEQVIPEDVGGWWIREVGIFDSDGDLFAYGNFPETYKPQLEEGSGRTQTIRVVIMVSDTAAITLKIDPAVVLATRQYVDDERAEHEASRSHPSATTSAKGFVELATQAEVDAGTDTTRPVVPARMAQSPLLRGKENNGNPNGDVAAARLYERCWDTSKTPADLYVATAVDGTVGGTTWTPIRDMVGLGEAMPGFIDGVVCANNATDPAHDIDFGTGTAVLRDGAGRRKKFVLSSTLTKQIDANWAAGDNAGGFPSGLALSAGEHYNLFLIGKDDGALDAGFDSDPSAGNLLSDSNYTWFRRVLSVLTDGNGDIRPFDFANGLVRLRDPIADATSLSGSGTVVTSVPPNQVGLFTAYLTSSSTNNLRGAIYPVNATDTEGNSVSQEYHFGMFDNEVMQRQFHGNTESIVNESSEVGYATPSGSMQLNTIAWRDDRGRDQ